MIANDNIWAFPNSKCEKKMVKQKGKKKDN